MVSLNGLVNLQQFCIPAKWFKRFQPFKHTQIHSTVQYGSSDTVFAGSLIYSQDCHCFTRHACLYLSIIYPTIYLVLKNASGYWQTFQLCNIFINEAANCCVADDINLLQLRKSSLMLCVSCFLLPLVVKLFSLKLDFIESLFYGKQLYHQQKDSDSLH